MAKYKSNTEYFYHNSDQGKTVAAEPVELELDGWVQAQLDAGLIVEVVEATAEAPAQAADKAKSKKDAE